jgi:hypothetical protein
MAYIDGVLEVLKSAPDPLTAHEIAEAMGRSPLTAPGRQPSEATITTWLYAITGSHDHPGVHRLDRRGERGSICWFCDAEPARGAEVH